MQDPRTSYNNLPGKEPATITVAGTQQRFKNIKNWIAPALDIILIYWQKKKLTVVHEHLTTKMSQLLEALKLVNTRKDGIGHERASKHNIVQLSNQ